MYGGETRKQRYSPTFVHGTREKRASSKKRKRGALMFQRLVVPLDGSQRAARAVPTAAGIARATNGTIVLLQVVSLPVEYPGGLAPAPIVTDELIEQDLAETNDYLAAVAHSES